MGDNVSFESAPSYDTWQNKLLQNMPFGAFRFLVETDGQKKIGAAFTSISGIRMTTQMAKARAGSDARGVQGNYPGITEFGNVKLEKGVVGYEGEFFNWLFSTNFPRNTEGPKSKDVYRDLRIIALNQNGKARVVFTLKNATPVSYELGEMDASQSAVLMESIEFAITGVTRTIEYP